MFYFFFIFFYVIKLIKWVLQLLKTLQPVEISPLHNFPVSGLRSSSSLGCWEAKELHDQKKLNSSFTANLLKFSIKQMYGCAVWNSMRSMKYWELL